MELVRTVVVAAGQLEDRLKWFRYDALFQALDTSNVGIGKLTSTNLSRQYATGQIQEATC